MRILVVEDNKDILSLIVDFLTSQHHQVDCAQDGLTGLHLAVTQQFDIIVLDIMLPGLDGYQFCQKLREDAKIETPIIMLTARDALDDKLKGLKLGADDYLLKPFELSELVARMESIVKRSNRIQKLLLVNGLKYNLDTMEVFRDASQLKINPIGMKLLALLMQRSPYVVKREFLENALWGEDVPDSDSLKAHIYQLRAIVDKPFSYPLIHTVHGVGYRIAQLNA
ncbi:response regulator transcription factor [Methylotenera versatilis]|uniref:response regulator transcription factor n=1 Tax=Methylotenera versatilis TaxID=1055487 RepID=UPI0006464028|nr:response regulator transcription factor [Methylotenera versatilis]